MHLKSKFLSLGLLFHSTSWAAGAQIDPQPRAWYAAGQVWVVWNVDTDNPPLTYAIYAKSTPGVWTEVSQGTLVGRLYPGEWGGQRLRSETQQAFGAPVSNYLVPTDGSGGVSRLQVGEGLFVDTVRSGGTPRAYAVVPWGAAAVTPAAVSNPVTPTYSTDDPPQMHLQATGLNTGPDGRQYPVSFYMLWADGDADEDAGRPDFPILANAHKRGSPHLYMAVEPPGGLADETNVPATFAFHGANGAATQWLPDGIGALSINQLPADGYLLAPDEKIWVMYNGAPDARNTSYLGYVRGFDPFTDHWADLANLADLTPPADETIVNYTQRQFIWVLDWFIRNRRVDGARVSLFGYSNGSRGVCQLARAFPGRFATVALFNNAMRYHTSPPRIPLLGDDTLNLPVTLTGRQGQPLHYLDVLNLNTPLSSSRDLPFLRIYDGKCDKNDAMHWGPDLIADFREADRIGWGFHVYWDLRQHGLREWLDYWVDAKSPATLANQTQRDDVRNLTRYRADQSFPAFFKLQDYPDHGDPGPGWLGGSQPGSPCGPAVDAEGNPVFNGDDHGTWGGYFDWELDTIVDTPENWQCTLFLVGAPELSGYAPVDESPSDALMADVAVRRPQQFKPEPGATLDWTLSRADTGAFLQSGQSVVAADGLVSVPGLTMFKDPKRARLEIKPAVITPPVDRVHVVTVNPDGSFTPTRVEIFSGDTVEWRFAGRTDAIVPVGLNAEGHPDCASPLPYVPDDPNEFTGPMPRAASGIFTLSPEEAPYTTQDETWQSSNLTGVFIRPRWDEVHLGPDQFQWAEVDAEIEQAVRHGKVFSIGFKAGVRGTPRWIFDPAATDAPVTPLDFGFRQEGRPAYYGSPADENYRKHYFAFLRAFAAHLRARNAWYRALAYVKICGLNLYTHENRLPKETVEDIATWAGPGRYTPTALLDFYHEQTRVLVEEFPDKSMSFALIQDGFPEINDAGEYRGQPTPPQEPIPSGAAQTTAVLEQGRLEHGLLFAVQHNGLQTKPAYCPGSGLHPIEVDSNFHYVGSGCPNRWVLAESAAGQVTGYQTVNNLADLFEVESALQNAWDNSDAVFLEVYETIGLAADGAGLPSGMTLGDWAERFHQRRRSAFPEIPDPFPMTHRHSFTRTTSGSTPQQLYYVNPAKCPGDTTPYGVIVILPVLRFESVSPRSDGSILLTLAAERPGTLRVEFSRDLLRDWQLLQSISTAGGTVEVTDTSAPSQRRFYRAMLSEP